MPRGSGNCTTVGYAVIGEEEEWITAAVNHLGQKYNMTVGDDGDIKR